MAERIYESWLEGTLRDIRATVISIGVVALCYVGAQSTHVDPANTYTDKNSIKYSVSVRNKTQVQLESPVNRLTLQDLNNDGIVDRVDEEFLVRFLGTRRCSRKPGLEEQTAFAYFTKAQ